MFIFYNFIRKYIKVLQKENLFRLTFVIIALILIGAFGLFYFEPDMKYLDAVWWSIVTVTTVGYGDISPASPGGRIIAVIVMLLGIGLLSVFTATVAAVFIERKIKEKKGIDMSFSTDHYILCGWNYKGIEIITELRSDPKCLNDHIVIIAEVDEKPVDDENIDFVSGVVNTENLEKANIRDAKGIIVLSDENVPAQSRDAKTILSTMTINSIRPDIYICVELMDKENIEHCKIAGADEIIVMGELSTNLLVHASLDHGISRVITELVSRRFGMELYKIKVPAYIVGKTFFEAVCDLKKEHNIICLGIEDIDGKDLLTNPDNDLILEDNINLIVISEQRPEKLFQ